MSNDSSPPRPGDTGNARNDPDATCELPPGESHTPHADSDLTSSIPQVDDAGLAPAADPHATQSQGLDDLNLEAHEQLVEVTAGKRAANSIGPYKLRQRLGAGGMGEVWVAEQSEPVKRRVALKLIKDGLGSREIIARFEAERQALALMNHPNIARILDAGTTAEGQPYFVMELVAGQPLTQYCDEHKLSIDQRLKLFLDVCGGVQHAHQKGIIHRDLKPGNIIVGLQDGVPVPKIIDFGLAKAMESTQRLTDQSLFTGIGQILGTLKYMSPEQASLDNLDIDTRTDIYALGVILYELLTGSTPLDDSSLKSQAAFKILELIREKEPVKPSSKLGSSSAEQVSSITGQRQTDSLRLKRILLGDLDWIVMKALEKDRTRRYDSASGFAADIRRYLHSEPVVARPPSLDYRVRKFVRKNRVGVLAAAVVLLTLVGGIIGTSLAMYRALAAETLAEERLVEANTARARAEAETAAKEKALAEETRQRQFAEAVTEFVEQDFLQLTSVEGQADLLEDASVRELNKDTTLRELLDRAAEKLKQRENLAPEIEARLCNVIGISYRLNGDAGIGIPFLERALQLRREQLGTEHPDTLTSMSNLALGYDDAGQLDRAVPLYEQALEQRKAKLGLNHHDTLNSMNNLALGYRDAGQLDRVLPLLEQTLELKKSILGPDHPDTLASMNNLALGYLSAGQLDRALPLYEQTLELMKAKLGPDHPVTLTSMNNLANGYKAAGQLNQALPLYEQSLEMTKAKLGPEHPKTLLRLVILAEFYREAGQLDRALQFLEQTVEMTKVKLGPDHPQTLTSMLSLANCYRDANQLDKALPLFEQTLALRKTKLGSDHPDTLISMVGLANLNWRLRKLERSIPLFEEVLNLQEKKLGRQHPATQQTIANLGVNYLDANRFAEAIPLLEEAYRSSLKYPTLEWVTSWLIEAYQKAEEIIKLQHLQAELLQRRAVRRATADQIKQLESITDPLEQFRAWVEMMSGTLEPVSPANSQRWRLKLKQVAEIPQILLPNIPELAISELELDECQLSVAGELVPRCTELNKLSFSGLVPDSVVEQLSAVPHLQALDFQSGSGISPSALQSLTRRFIAINSLSFNAFPLGGADLKVFGTLAELDRLVLFGAALTDQQVSQAVWPAKLQYLELGGNRELTGRGLAATLQERQPWYLSVYGTACGDEFAREIAQVKSLRFLGLGKSNITDAGLPELALLTGLETLELQETQVRSAGLAALKPFVNLKTLDLSQTAVDDSALDVITGFTELQVLKIKGTQLSEQGLKSIQTKLPNCQIMR